VSPTTFRLDEIRDAIKPFRLHWFSRLRSTSDHALTLRRARALYAPAVVLTGHQIAGRGRGSNTWWSGPGVLTATFVLPIDTTLDAFQLPLVAGLTVRHAAAELSGDGGISLKWPNDILYGQRKLAGLLCERAEGVDLVGIGLNVCPDRSHIPREVANRVVSLSDISPGKVDMTHTLICLASHLRQMIRLRTEVPYSQLLREYDQYHALVGRRVTVLPGPGETPVSGKCEGVDAIGRLLIRDGATLHRLIAGQVQRY